MTSADRNPLLEPFLTAAETLAATRSDVDPELAREVLVEAATMLHDGLALDGLDDHDTCAAATGLARALTAPDPGVAVHESAEAALADGAGLHDPGAVSAAYLVAASILRI